jgi:hypothetical protein
MTAPPHRVRSGLPKFATKLAAVKNVQAVDGALNGRSVEIEFRKAAVAKGFL